MDKKTKLLLEEEAIIIIVMLFMIIGSGIAGESKSFMTVRIGAHVKFVHVQLVNYFIETLGLERDVTDYISHEVKREKPLENAEDAKQTRSEIVVVH